MAEDFNKSFRELEKTLRELGASTTTLGIFAENMRQAGDDADKMSAVIQSMSDRVEVLKTRFDAVSSSTEDISKMLADQIASVTSATSLLGRQKTMYSNIANITRDIAMDSIGVVDLNKRDIADRVRKLETLQTEFDFQSKIARTQLQALYREQVLLNSKLAKTGELNKREQSRLNAIQKEVTNLEHIAQFNAKESTELQGTIEKLNKRSALETEISKTVGVTGAIIEGTGAFMERLGMRSGIFHDAMKDAAQTMRDQAKLLNQQVGFNIELVEKNEEQIKLLEDKLAKGEELTDQEKKRLQNLKDQNKELKTSVSFYDRTKVALQGAGILAKGFGAALSDPATIVAAIGKGFLDVNKAATQAARYTGQYSSELQGGLNRLASTKDILETTVELTKELGMSANAVFSGDMLANAAELKNTMGLAAKEVAGLALQAKASGKSIDGVVDSTVEQVNAYNRANKSAVNHRMVLEDVGNASDSIRASVSLLPGGLAKAAASARRLGMSLSDVDAIADKLLDFESSIEAELEAQLLTGKNINMAKARELALNNDLAGLGNELFKNASDIHEFGKMNRIQQEAQAKALGMTRDQLARVAYQRALEAGMTAEQAAQAANVNAEDMKRMDIQEKIQKAIERLQQAFAPILDVAVDIVDALTPAITVIGGIVGGTLRFLKNLGILKPLVISIMAAIAARAALSNITAIGGKLGEIANTAKSAKDAVLGLFKSGGIDKAKESIKEYGKAFTDAFKGVGGAKDKVDEVTKDAQGRWRDSKGKFAKAPAGADKAQDIAQDAKAMEQVKEPTAQGQKIKEFLSGLAEGLKKMGEKGVLKGALNLIPASIGFVTFIPGYLGAKLVEKLDGGKIQQSLTALGEGIKAFGDSVTAGSLLKLGAAGLAFAAFTAGAIGLGAVALLGAPAGTGLTALGTGLTAFAQAMAIPTPFGPVGLVAPVALALLGAAMIPFAKALSIAAPAIKAFGEAIKLAFEGIGSVITAIFGGLTQFLSVITLEKALAIGAMGLAFGSMAVGLAALGGAAIFGIAGLGMLGAISMMGPGLALAGSGVTALAEGVARLSAAMNSLETEKLKEVKDLIMTTAFAAPAVAATGAITSLIQGLTGGGEDESTAAKLDELIAAVKAGHIVDIYLDGDKISRQQALTAGQGV